MSIDVNQTALPPQIQALLSTTKTAFEHISSEENEKIQRLLRLISNGITPNEMQAILSLLAEIGHLINPVVLNYILSEIRNMLHDMIENKVDRLPANSQAALAEDILKALLDGVLSKFNV